MKANSAAGSRTPGLSQLTDNDAQRLTERWLQRVVVGLHLCPFAAPVIKRGLLDIVISDAQDDDAAVAALDTQLMRLQTSAASELETIILVLPSCWPSFFAFNDFLSVADALLDARGMIDDIQIASFHPAYQFADTEPDDISNYTNRSPFPTLHLLRESSVSEAVDQHPNVDAIGQTNIRRMQNLDAAQRESLFAINDSVTGA